jgi:hypothetical protein
MLADGGTAVKPVPGAARRGEGVRATEVARTVRQTHTAELAVWVGRVGLGGGSARRGGLPGLRALYCNSRICSQAATKFRTRPERGRPRRQQCTSAGRLANGYRLAIGSCCGRGRPRSGGCGFAALCFWRRAQGGGGTSPSMLRGTARRELWARSPPPARFSSLRGSAQITTTEHKNEKEETIYTKPFTGPGPQAPAHRRQLIPAGP